mmetsp:Transcript_35078/g.96996  ORF Transcript_35078/g.96996 Transcript_35078/m.96996 type:complete len:331 (-) Transcript_35078:41-1033(-)
MGGQGPSPEGMPTSLEDMQMCPQACDDFMVDLTSPTRLCKCGSPKSEHTPTSRRRLARGSVHQLAQAFAAGGGGNGRASSEGSIRPSLRSSEAVLHRQAFLQEACLQPQQKCASRVEAARQMIAHGTVAAECAAFETAQLSARSARLSRGELDGKLDGILRGAAGLVAHRGRSTADNATDQASAGAGRSISSDCGEEPDAEDQGRELNTEARVQPGLLEATAAASSSTSSTGTSSTSPDTSGCKECLPEPSETDVSTAAEFVPPVAFADCSSSSSSSSSRRRKKKRRRSSNFQSIQMKKVDDPKQKKEDKKRKKNRSAGAEAAAFLLNLK